MKIKIQPKKKTQWAIFLILISIPLSYYGFRNLEEGASEPLEAILISLACTGGIACFFGGLYVFFTKAKGRGEDLLASQTKVGYSPISLALNETPEDFKDSSTNLRNTSHPLVSGGVVEKTINKKQKANEMAKANTSVDLMKRELELLKRKKELRKLLSEVDGEIIAVQKDITKKGWVAKEDGWSIG